MFSLYELDLSSFLSFQSCAVTFFCVVAKKINFPLALQVGIFPKLSGEEFDNYIALAEKLRSDYDFGHTLDAKLLPRGETSVSGPIVRLFKPFDEQFVDFKVSEFSIRCVLNL